MRRAYYWGYVLRSQVVRYSDGSKTVSQRTGPGNWTRITKHPGGARSVTTSRTEPGPLGKMVWGGAGIVFAVIGPVMVLGPWSIPIYVLMAIGLVIRLQHLAGKLHGR